MKMKLIILLMSVCIMYACSNSEQKSSVCVFDNASLLDQPSKKEGKWLSAVSLGEKLTYLDEKEDGDDAKKRSYTKVKLLDGKEGWILSEMVAVDAVPAAVTDKIEIYNRPDLSTVSKKSFEPLDVIAVGPAKDGWVEVKGKRQKGKWVDKGYVKEAGYTTNEKDIAAALFFSRAITKPKKEQVLEELRKIKENNELSGSVFDQKIDELIAKLDGSNNTSAPDAPSEEVEMAIDSSSVF